MMSCLVYLPAEHDSLESFLSSLEQEEDCSEADCSDGKPLDTSSSMNTASKSWKPESEMDSLTTPQSSETSDNSSRRDMRKPTLDTLMSSAQASRSCVNHFQSPESKKEKTTAVTCGRTPFASLEQSGPNGAYLKTSQGCLPGLMDTLDEYCVTFPRAGIMSGGTVWQLPPLAPLTRGTDSGLSPLWSTPIRSDAAGCVQSEKALAMGFKPRLTTQAKYWRTPGASDGEGGVMEMRKGKTGHYKLRDHVHEKNQHMWPTPAAQEPGWKHITVVDKDGNAPEHPNQRFYHIHPGEKPHDRRTGKPVQTALADAVRWPTPTTRDHKDTGDSVANGTVPVNGYLGRAVSPSKAEGALNPDWVEWLMGWPIYWTDLEPLRDISYWEENIERWWDEDPAESGHIPRITTQKKNRVNRLKAIGNGQVPLCAAVAFLLLQGDLL